MGNLTGTLALEYADRNIRVKAVAPGAIETPLSASWVHYPGRRVRVESRIPVGLAGTFEESAAVIEFLASGEVSCVTGQTIYACGVLTLFDECRSS